MDQLAINLAAGVVGALIGAFAAYRLQVREARRLDKGAVRAVYMELATNKSAARHGGTRIGKPSPILFAVRQDVYRAEIARLGAYLTPRELMAVTWAYQLLPDAVIALETMRAGGGRESDDPERAILLQLAETIEPALAALQPRAWTEAERKSLETGVPGWPRGPRRPGSDSSSAPASPSEEAHGG